MTREEKTIVAHTLRDQGLIGREIAERLGISKQYVSELFNDPDGSKAKARKDLHRRPCLDCGILLSGSDGSGPNAPKRCTQCAPRHAFGKWSKEAIVAAIIDFHSLRHRPPHVGDFDPWLATRLGHHDRADMFWHHDSWPHSTTVLGYFGSWNAAIRAAGFTPTAVGHWDAEEGAA